MLEFLFSVICLLDFFLIMYFSLESVPQTENESKTAYSREIVIDACGLLQDAR